MFLLELVPIISFLFLASEAPVRADVIRWIRARNGCFEGHQDTQPSSCQTCKQNERKFEVPRDNQVELTSEGWKFEVAYFVISSEKKRLRKKCKLDQADLSCCDLTNEDKTGPDLLNHSFFGKKIMGADLTETKLPLNLRSVNGTGAKLEKIHFGKADFLNSDFSFASFRGSNLLEVTGICTQIKSHDLWPAFVQGAIFDQKTVLPRECGKTVADQYYKVLSLGMVYKPNKIGIPKKTGPQYNY